MEKQQLDYILVPLGVLLMVAYHVWLFLRVHYHPARTVLGVNAINRRVWVNFMIEDQAKNGILAVQTLRNNLMASTLMASTAIMLCSLIAVLMNSTTDSSSRHEDQAKFIYGSTSNLVISIKFFCILLCFMVAFLCYVQSIRYYNHASFLINVPVDRPGRMCPRHVTIAFVSRAINRGSYFWSLGLRAFYFSFPLFLWIFGPIPMFVCCVAMVFMLYFLDVSSEWKEEDASEAEIVPGGRSGSSRVDRSV